MLLFKTQIIFIENVSQKYALTIRVCVDIVKVILEIFSRKVV